MHWGLTLVTYSAGAAAIGGSLVGLIFRGAATAWREERDAAVDKAERLEKTVDEQATKILTLEGKVEVLEKRTDYEVYAERSGREHAEIVASIVELARNVSANTTAIESLVKQVFPTAVADSALRAAAQPPSAA